MAVTADRRPRALPARANHERLQLMSRICLHTHGLRGFHVVRGYNWVMMMVNTSAGPFLITLAALEAVVDVACQPLAS